jgi:hypothetical protein
MEDNVGKIDTRKWSPNQGIQSFIFDYIDDLNVAKIVHDDLLLLQDRARIKILGAKDSTGWLSTPPHRKSFRYFNKSQFTLLFKLFLGCVMFPENQICDCKQKMDIFGHHALSCKKGGGVVQRHDHVRDVMLELSKLAGMNPSSEEMGYMVNKKDRVGDISLPMKDNGREILYDGTVWNPLFNNRLSKSVGSIDYTIEEAHNTKLKI